MGLIAILSMEGQVSRKSLFYIVTGNMSCMSAIGQTSIILEKVWKWYKTGRKAPMSNRYYLDSDSD